MVIDTAVADVVATVAGLGFVAAAADFAGICAVEKGWAGGVDVVAAGGSDDAADVASAVVVSGKATVCAADIAVADVAGAGVTGCANDIAAVVDDGAVVARKSDAVDTAAAVVAAAVATDDDDAVDAAADDGRPSRRCQVWKSTWAVRRPPT